MLLSGLSSEWLQRVISVYTAWLQRTLYGVDTIQQTSSKFLANVEQLARVF